MTIEPPPAQGRLEYPRLDCAENKFSAVYNNINKTQIHPTSYVMTYRVLHLYNVVVVDSVVPHDVVDVYTNQ